MEPAISRVTGRPASTVLTDAARRQRVWLLAAGDRDVVDRAREPARSVGVAGHHVGRLRSAGTVGIRRKGPRPVDTAHDREVIAGAEAAGTGHHRRRLRPPAARWRDHA